MNGTYLKIKQIDDGYLLEANETKYNETINEYEVSVYRLSIIGKSRKTSSLLPGTFGPFLN
jgi:hypothetical protein